jgi:hypothetical protein
MGWREAQRRGLGMAIVLNRKKRATEALRSSRVIVSVSVFVRWWCEQSGLRCFRYRAGTVCLVTFAGETISVLPGFLNQGERVGDKAKVVLRNWQAVGAFYSHGLSEIPKFSER